MSDDGSGSVATEPNSTRRSGVWSVSAVAFLDAVGGVYALGMAGLFVVLIPLNRPGVVDEPAGLFFRCVVLLYSTVVDVLPPMTPLLIDARDLYRFMSRPYTEVYLVRMGIAYAAIGAGLFAMRLALLRGARPARALHLLAAVVLCALIGAVAAMWSQGLDPLILAAMVVTTAAVPTWVALTMILAPPLPHESRSGPSRPRWRLVLLLVFSLFWCGALLVAFWISIPVAVAIRNWGF